MRMLLAILVISLWAFHPTASITTGSEGQAAYHKPNADLVEDEYIVFLQQNHTLEARVLPFPSPNGNQILIEADFNRIGKNLSESAPMFRHLQTLNAYRVRLDNFTIHELVRYDPGVAFIEHDSRLQNIDSTTHQPDHQEYTSAPVKISTILTRELSKWSKNLRRTSAEIAKRYYYSAMIGAGGKIDFSPEKCSSDCPTFTAAEGPGQGVDIYIFDSGIMTTHNYFRHLGTGQTRASNFQGKTITPYITVNGKNDMTMDDTTGHGTRVAGLAGGADYSAASYANLINVKVRTGSPNLKIPEYGTTAGATEALNDVIKAHQSNLELQNKNDPKIKGWKGSVINMSFTIPYSAALEKALDDAYDSGIPMAIAAGNNREYVNSWPCAHSKVRCVGASDMYYKFAEGSNYGGNIDAILPGVNITSASWEGKDKESVESGTSFASPLLAGIMAAFVGYEGLNQSPAAVYQRVTANQLQGAIDQNSIPQVPRFLRMPTDKPTQNLFSTSGISFVKDGDSTPPYRAKGDPVMLVAGLVKREL